jgi:hypothetical protein
MTRTLYNPAPAFYVQCRAAGTDDWGERSEFYAFPSVLEAVERARHLAQIGALGIVAGRLYEWKLVRNGVTVHAWREEARP